MGSDLPTFHEPAYRFHSRVRIVAVVITVFLVVVEVLLVRRITEQAYSGIILNNVTVVRVSRGSPAEEAGIRKGDEVVSFGGVACRSLKDVSECLSRVGPGNTATYTLQRDGEIMDIPLTFARLPSSEILRKASLLVVGFSFVGIGLVVYFRRADKLALVFYLLCFAFGLVLVNVVNFELGTARYAYRSVFNDLLVLSLPALFLHFFLLFPEKSRVLSRHPQLERSIYVPVVMLFAVSTFFNVMLFSYGKTYIRALAAFQNVTAAYFIAFIIMGLGAFIRAYRSRTTDYLRRKLRLVVWGTIAGTLPLVFVRVIVSIEPAIEIPGEKVVFLPLILVPMAFGHAIVRYGLLDLEIVFKRSLVYTFLIAVLASVYFVVVYGIGRLVSRFIGSADLLFSVVSIFVITLLISPLRARIRSAVDKTFFRDEYNYRRVLKQISHSLAGMIDLESVVSYLCIRVAEVLQASAAVVFILDDRIGKYRARYGVHVEHAMIKGFDVSSSLSNHLRRTQSTLNLEREIESKRPLAISRQDADTLLSTRAAFVVPFVFKSKLLGFISIGKKRSDEFYSSTDVELLETLCDHVALAIENARLHLEAVEKQRMQKDLELAREIQHRFLPKAFPEIPGLKTHAVNVPSELVGGDYYDVIILSESKVAVVIADVSGKGVPAALLMASLQSSLRAEADPGRLPSEVISTLNTAIYEHTSGGTFVTIFYGVIDLETETVTYCNAGQTPPILLGKDAAVKMLDETDIVIGIDSTATYRNTTVSLHRGDLLFLYTDGITDELDVQDQPYGEARLVQELERCSQLDLASMMKRVHEAVMDYTQGQPQDDLTALAMRIEAFAAVPSTVRGRKKT